MSQPDYDRMPSGDSTADPTPTGRILHAMRALSSEREFGEPAATDPPIDELSTTAPPATNLDPDLLAALRLVTVAGGSDLHVAGGAPPSVRIDGALRPIVGWARWSPGKVAAALGSILSPEQREEFARELELDFAYTIESFRFRVNFYQQRGSVSGAFRLIPNEIRSLGELGVPASVSRFAHLPRGLVLVTGPTGSGKTTTLAAIVDLVNSTRTDHIVTVEDPIEFVHESKKCVISQREVGQDTHSFATALKHVLRQDPDVILIGELRDLETISVALTAAETGHLVFSTLHTQDAAQTIDRIIDVFPAHQQAQVRAQLAATLRGVLCQTLVRKVGGWTGGGHGDPGFNARHSQPDSGGQDPPDRIRAAIGARTRHAHHGSAPRRARRCAPDHATGSGGEGPGYRGAQAARAPDRSDRPIARRPEPGRDRLQ
ncbi:type IV pilus twitching motility protein PilT [Cryobacterium sp. Y62]|uniref:type IV pilus twitching motility protein PilT n=1 Tax=Cryobacterium sp. Y62 TaxID=2048284 RepID=UPI002711E6AD|nr:PilT/PilU family type 4a pilus ATPase [Cryobacterium sp. Y62]